MLWNRWRLVRTIRRHRFDHIILANGGWRYARTLGGKQMIGFREPGAPDNRQPDVLAHDHGGRYEHEVSKMATLGALLGVKDALGPLKVYPNDAPVFSQRQRLTALGWNPERPSIAFHISARKAERRWKNNSFADLAERLIADYGVQILLFWSPGKKTSPMHPGDDEDASFILKRLEKLPVFPCPTDTIRVLINGMSLADQVVCSDGGGVHVAAALKKTGSLFLWPK
jgi:ADP-heptose:LPS heptosyltransferase